MSTAKNNFSYSKTIRLAPAVGDWTTIQFREDLDDSHISSIHNIGFNSLAKDKLRYAHLLHYRLAEQLVNKLSIDLDIKVELHSVTASQLSYQEFLSAFQTPSVQYQLTIPSVGKSSIVLDNMLTDYMLNRLTGGSASETEVHHSFSDIDLSIVQTQIEQLLPLFSQSWKSLFLPDQIQIESASGPIHFDPKMSLREAITTFTFQATFGNQNLQRLSWVYPSETLRKLLHARSVLPDPLRRRVFLQSKTIRNIKTEVKAVLGRASLTMKELRGLQVGDIIPLDTMLNSPLELILGKTTKFQIQAGVLQNRLCGQLIFLDSDYSLPAPSAAHSLSEPVMAVAPPPPPPVYQTVAPPPPPPVTPPVEEPVVAPEFTEDAEEFTDDWSAGYTGATSAATVEDEDHFEIEDDESVSDQDGILDEHEDDDDEETLELEDDTWGTLTSETENSSTPPAPSAPAIETKEEDDDLSWDSLDDHF